MVILCRTPGASLVQSPLSVSADASQDVHETRSAIISAAGRRRCRTGAISIDIRLWQSERVAQEFKARLGTVSDNDLDDVETKKNIRVIQEPEPGKTAASNSFLFVAIDGVGRSSELFARPRFHFDKDECVVFATDDVDLAPGASAKITIEDLVTVPPQKPARQLLSAMPKPKMRGTRSRKVAAPPVRKIGDESDKVRAHAI